MKSKGLVELYILTFLKEHRRRSATNSIYWHIREEFMPMRPTGNASVKNSFSMSTASVTIFAKFLLSQMVVADA